MAKTTDVFVIGGGPAGLAGAIAARKRGFRVIVADGTEPPIDKACGEGLMPDTLIALRKLGVTVTSHEGFPFRGIRFLDGHVRAEASLPSGPGMGIRRIALHRKMVEQAQRIGITTLWNTPVTGLGREGIDAGGETIAARWVIGADGIGSRVRRWAGLERSSRSHLRYAWRRHYSVNSWSDNIEIYWTPNGQAYVTPVGTQDVCVVLVSRQPGIGFTSLDTEFPELSERLAGASVADRERGAVTMSFRLDQVCTERIALIGDASGSVDAITGDGLCLSFRQAEALSDAMEAGDLGQYQSAHRRLMRRPALMSRLLLLLAGHPALRHWAISAMAADPDIFSRLLSVHVGARSTSHLAATGALLGWRLIAKQQEGPLHP
jgi:2-polyprenyl-6-methoxyphenol hydroxylase-like FAD-dependent oxidoreductase